MDRLKIGVIGTGGIFLGLGRLFGHLPAYPNVPEAKLTALCDLDKGMLSKAEYSMKEIYKQEYERAQREENIDEVERLKEDIDEVKKYSDYKEMINENNLDIVDICTPPDTHVDISQYALKRGINVMCEKPMARNWLECLDIINTVSDTGKIFQYGEDRIFSTYLYNAKKVIETGEIGEVLFISLIQSTGEPGMRSVRGGSPKWYWSPERSGGGSLLDVGVHEIANSWFLVGFERKPVLVKSANPHGITTSVKTRFINGSFKKDIGVEDDSHVLVQFEDSSMEKWTTTAYIESSWTCRKTVPPMIIGSDGILKFGYNDGSYIFNITKPQGGSYDIPLFPTEKLGMYVRKPDKFEEEFGLPIEMGGYIDGFQRRIINMCLCVHRGAKPLCDERVGADVMAVVDAAYLSELKGRKSISIDEFKKSAIELKEKEGNGASNKFIKRSAKQFTGENK